MGQYFKIGNLDRKEWVHPQSLKLMEHSWLRNPAVMFVEQLLIIGNPWHKTRLVWAGDYGKALEHLTKKQISTYQEFFPKAYPDQFAKYPDQANPDLYDFCEHSTDKHYKKWMFKELRVSEPDFSYLYKNFPFIVNHTKKEYVNKRQCPSIGGWRVHPLPLLTCTGSNSGGSYYTEDPKQLELIGSWAGDVISVESVKPECFTLIRPNFAER